MIRLAMVLAVICGALMVAGFLLLELVGLAFLVSAAGGALMVGAIRQSGRERSVQPSAVRVHTRS